MRPRRAGSGVVRVVAVLLTLLSVMAAFLPSAAGQTSTSTGVSVQVSDKGTLEIAWLAEGYAFAGEGGGALEVSAEGGATASSVFSFDIDDTRTGANRPSYSVSLRLDPFVVNETGQTFGAESVRITAIEGLPSNVQSGIVLDKNLGTAVPLFSVDKTGGRIDATVSVTLTMVVPPGTGAGTYTSVATLDVIPAGL